MPHNADITFDDLVLDFLGRPLPANMAASFPMSRLSPEAQDFTKRMLSLMKRAGYPVSNFNPHLIRWLSATVPSILPGAWGGRIPPLTLPGRHKKLDSYVAGRVNFSADETQVFLDVGCGFPPVTSVDTANKLADWHIYGVDRSFADYVLYDADGHYACFDQNGTFLYFQALMNTSGRALYADPGAARKRFEEFFSQLYPAMQNVDGPRSETVMKDGNKLIHHHIRDFEADNLMFIESEFMNLGLPAVRVLRCMNVLVYFEPETRKKMLAKAAELLQDDGILIAGTNGLGIQSRYAVYLKDKDCLILDEFSFGLDNLGHITFMPYFTIHENDPEAMLLANLADTIRSSPFFWTEFSRRQDEMLEQQEICQRQPDGLLHFPENEISVEEYLQRNTLLWKQLEEEGYLDGAVNVLKQAGYDASKNSVGDIAIKPTAITDIL